MIANLDPQPQIIQHRSPNLVLHCGASHVELDEIRSVATPRHTQSWCPIPHAELISTVQRTLATTICRSVARSNRGIGFSFSHLSLCRLSSH